MFGVGGCDGGGEVGELGGFALAFGICLVVVERCFSRYGRVEGDFFISEEGDGSEEDC